MRKVGQDAIGKLEQGLLDSESSLVTTASRIAASVAAALAGTTTIPDLPKLGAELTLPAPVNPASSKVIPIANAKQQQQQTTTAPASVPKIEQNLTINSPTPLTPSEVARQTKNASRQLVMEW